MLNCNAIVTFFNGFSRGDIIAIAGIIIAVIFIWWDIRKRRQDRIDTFIDPFLRFKTIFETKSIPDHASYNRFITDLFAEQDNAMSIIRNRMDEKTKTAFENKWAEYKDERERYKRYWDIGPSGKALLHVHSKHIIDHIDELIKIVKDI